MSEHRIDLTVNGLRHSARVEARTGLGEFLRDALGYTGTHLACEHGVCGACTVMVNGRPEKSCDTTIGEVAGANIMTIEGLKNDPLGARLQKAWLQYQVPQCGFCQSGMLMAAYGRLKAGESVSSTANGIPNLCQCGTFQRVKDAIMALPTIA